MFEELENKIYSSPVFNQIRNSGDNSVFLTGIRGSLLAFAALCLGRMHNKVVFCSTDTNRLFRLKDDLNLLAGNSKAVVYLSEFDEEYESDVSPLSSALKTIDSDEQFFILTNPASLNKKIISKDNFRDKIIRLAINTEYGFDTLISKLNEFGFVKKKIVEEENDFAVRGGIVDIYPENLNQPVRVEFYGNSVESIREFDIVTQRSISKLDSADVLPSIDTMDELMEGDLLVNYLGTDTFIIEDEPDIIKHKSESLFDKLLTFDRAYISSFPLVKSESISESNRNYISEIFFDSRSQPGFSSNIKMFFSNLNELSASGYEIYITSSDDYQSKRTKELIEDLDETGSLTGIRYLDNSFHEGF